MGSRSSRFRYSGRSRASGPPESTRRPLLVTGDADLLDDLLRLAAAAGVEVDVVPDAVAVRGDWSTAPVVVIGHDVAGDMPLRTLPRRNGVYLVGGELDDASIWRRAVDVGAESVVFFPDDEPWLADRLADAAEGDRDRAVVIGTVGGRGGAGASVLATTLALAASGRDLAVTLVDLDPLGGGLDMILGAELSTGLRWPDLATAQGRLSARTLRAELPGWRDLAVLSWDRGDLLDVPAAAVSTVLAAARRSSDLVVIDLPRHLGAPAEEAVAACGVLVVVVPTEVRAVASASRVVARFAPLAHDVAVATRDTGTAGLTLREVSSALGLPALVHIGADDRLAARLDRGEPPAVDHRSPLGVACAEILEIVGPAQAGAA